MAGSRKSFFSTIPGFVTGLAGLVSAVVAAVGLAVQQGWIGGDGDSSAPATAGDGGAEFSVEPTTVTFRPVGSSRAEVTVRNTGEVGLRLEEPTVTGDDAERFEVAQGTCDAPVDPGRSCQLEVTFDPATGDFTATLVVEAEDAPQAREVTLRGSGVL